MIAQTLHTEKRIQAIGVTETVRAGLAHDGLHLLSCPHTTAALLLMQNDDDLLIDLDESALHIARALGPLRHDKNDNPNGAAHLVSATFGTQVLVPVEGSAPSLGTYQHIVFLELDGPKESVSLPSSSYR